MAHDTECSTDPQTNQPQWYWVSRDRSPTTGELVDYCDLWFVKPMHHLSGDGAVWDTRDVTPEGAQQYYGWYARYALKDIVKWCYTIPDNDRQLLVVGRRD
jgi:hypothetical protein